MLSRILNKRYLVIGNLLVLVSLAILPFSRAYSTWNVEYLSNLNFNTNFFHTASDLPLLYPLLAILVANLVVAFFVKQRSLFTAAMLWMNLAGAALLVVVFFVNGVVIGMGGYVYFFASLLFAASALSRRGTIKGDTFISSSILVIGITLVTFIVFPLLSVLKTSMMSGSSFNPKYLYEHLHGYSMLGRVVRNSLMLGISSASLSTVAGLIFALVVGRGRYSFVRRIAQPFSVLPIITPPFVLGISLIFMMGRMGYITHALLGMRTAFIYGYPGLVIVQALSFTPMAYLIISGNLGGIHTDPEEASASLGASPATTFRRVLLPLLRPALANSFLVAFSLSLADFGNPMVIGGDFDVLATEIYFSIIGRYDQSLASALSLVLVSMTLTIFFLQRWWMGNRSYVTITGMGGKRSDIRLPKKLDIAMSGFVMFWAAITIVLYGSVVLGSFFKLWGINYSLTLDHYRAFLIDGLRPYKTTVILALISTVPTVIVGWLIAYLTKRFEFRGRSLLEGTSLLSFAIPGTVVGIGYLMAFNNPPLVFTNTAFILLACFVFRNMPVGIRSALSAMEQIDDSLDESSLSLGANNFTTMRRVILPLVRTPILTAMIYSFVRAMTAVSAVIFLYTAKTKLATTTILGRIEAGRLGLATAFCTIMIVTMIVVIGLMYLLVTRVWGEKMKIEG